MGEPAARRRHHRRDGSQDQGAGLPRQPVRRLRRRREAHPRAGGRARQAGGLRLRGDVRPGRARAMISYGPALLSVLLSLAAIGGYIVFLRVPAVRNHPALYLVAFAIPTAIAGVATWRAARWPHFVALRLSLALLTLGRAVHPLRPALQAT